jgi:hypothetical protein
MFLTRARRVMDPALGNTPRQLLRNSIDSGKRKSFWSPDSDSARLPLP